MSNVRESEHGRIEMTTLGTDGVGQNPDLSGFHDNDLAYELAVRGYDVVARVPLAGIVESRKRRDAARKAEASR